MRKKVWFWQRIFSPHMAGLVASLALRGYQVTVVVEAPMSRDRADTGWGEPDSAQVHLHVINGDMNLVEKLISHCQGDEIHFTQGVRGNGYIKFAQKCIMEHGYSHWIIMETVNDDNFFTKYVKAIEYRRIIFLRRNALSGILAIGHSTPTWLTNKGMPNNKIFPFAYFLKESENMFKYSCRRQRTFKILFVGRLVRLKRLDLLIGALKRLSREFEFQLDVVGQGDLEAALRAQAQIDLPGRVNWLGMKPLAEIPSLMAAADCLVLPSRHDGWGAVVSEALMAGTPAICSDRCGSAEVVRHSGVGGVFRAGDEDELFQLLHRQVQDGPLSERRRREVAHWARGLGASAGAAYLSEILEWHVGLPRPIPPWRRGDTCIENADFGDIG